MHLRVKLSMKLLLGLLAVPEIRGSHKGTLKVVRRETIRRKLEGQSEGPTQFVG